MTEDQAEEMGTKNTYIFYSTKLAFRYQVNGQDYTTETVQFGRAIRSGDISDEAVLLLRYPAGTKVTVFYHPHDPALAAAKHGVNTDVAWYVCGGAILILFGVAILAPGLRNFWCAYASQGWPTTDGTVVYMDQEATGQVIQDSKGRTGQFTMHGAPLAYQYKVNGEWYFSNVRHFGQFIRSSSQDWAEAIFQRYPAGTGVPVSYCPTDPDLAALEPGINSESYYLPGAGLAFLLFGIAAMIWSFR